MEKNEVSDQKIELSKSAKKKLLKQQRQAAKKAERKSKEKERKRTDLERRRKEWEEKLNNASTEEERLKMIDERKEVRKERMGKRLEERATKLERLYRAKEIGQKIVLDLDFVDLMTPTEIHSLVQQIMYCYAENGRSASPAHLYLTGCQGEMETQLQRIPGFDKWVIEKENKPYIEALENQKDNLVYLTADAESTVDELDPKKTYIIGGLVDRNRWKGITLKKATEQGIQSAKLPIGSYLKMSSSQVLTVNQVVEILLKFIETKDWQDAFFQVIPQRKREGDSEAAVFGDNKDDDAAMANADEDAFVSKDEEEEEGEEGVTKKQRTEQAENAVMKDSEGGRVNASVKEATNGISN